MKRIPMRVRGVLAGVTALALGCLVGAVVFQPPTWDGRALAQALLLGGVVLATRLSPLHLASRTKFFVSTAPLFVAVLCLPAFATVSLTAAAILGAEYLLRRPWFQAAFNVAVGVTQVAAGVATFHLVAGQDAFRFSDLGRMLAGALLAASALYLVNLLLVGLMVSVQQRRAFPAVLRQLVGVSVRTEFFLSLAGLAVAALVVAFGSVVVLSVAQPCLALYVLTRRSAPAGVPTRLAA